MEKFHFDETSSLMLFGMIRASSGKQIEFIRKYLPANHVIDQEKVVKINYLSCETWSERQGHDGASCALSDVRAVMKMFNFLEREITIIFVPFKLLRSLTKRKLQPAKEPPEVCKSGFLQLSSRRGSDATRL